MNFLAKTTGVSALMMALVLAAGCNREPDPEDMVSRQLKNEHLTDVDVEYDRDAKVMHLKGTVDTSAQKARAEDVARQIVGTTGQVANELMLTSDAEAAAADMDGAIRGELNAKVKNDRSLESRDVNFDVNNGVVTITGEVRSAAEREKVGEMARSTQNVKDVVNSLTIDGEMTEGGTADMPDKPRRP